MKEKKFVVALALCKKRYKKINSQRLEQCGQNKLNLLSTTVNNGNQEHTSLYTNKKSVRLTDFLSFTRIPSWSQLLISSLTLTLCLNPYSVFENIFLFLCYLFVIQTEFLT